MTITVYMNYSYILQFEYRMPMREVRQRTLQVTVWSAELTGNEFLGAAHINLFDADLSKELTDWYKLSSLRSYSKSNNYQTLSYSHFNS